MVHQPHLLREVEAILSSFSPSSVGGECFVTAALAELRRAGWHPASGGGDPSPYLIRHRVGLEFSAPDALTGLTSLVARHLAFFVGDVIDVGIEILPMKELQSEMSSGPSYYEGELYNVLRQGRGVPGVPLVLIGVGA
jgi:hypothetical protein